MIQEAAKDPASGLMLLDMVTWVLGEWKHREKPVFTREIIVHHSPAKWPHTLQQLCEGAERESNES